MHTHKDVSETVNRGTADKSGTSCHMPKTKKVFGELCMFHDELFLCRSVTDAVNSALR